jgi:hypothetical protein
MLFCSAKVGRRKTDYSWGRDFFPDEAVRRETLAATAG